MSLLRPLSPTFSRRFTGPLFNPLDQNSIYWTDAPNSPNGLWHAANKPFIFYVI